eukprot:8807258-Alexandrium_andersonii.AAC.1
MCMCACPVRHFVHVRVSGTVCGACVHACARIRLKTGSARAVRISTEDTRRNAATDRGAQEERLRREQGSHCNALLSKPHKPNIVQHHT